MKELFNKRFFFLLVMLMLTITLSCSEEVVSTPYTYTQIFSGKNSKTWVYKSIILWQKDKPDTNFGLPSCIRDDRYIFYSNAEKLFEVTNGPTKCAPEEPNIIISDTWAFINAGATLNMTIPFLAEFNLPFIVREVSKKNMLLEIFLDFEGTQSYRIAFESIDEK